MDFSDYADGAAGLFRTGVDVWGQYDQYANDGQSGAVYNASAGGAAAAPAQQPAAGGGTLMMVVVGGFIALLLLVLFLR